jgi:glycerate 2-kinase
MLFKNYEEIIKNGKTPVLKSIRKDILDILDSVIQAIDPYTSVKSKINGNKIILDEKTIDLSDYKDVYLAAFGKASIGMAQAVCDSLRIKEGIVITNETTKKVECENVYTFAGGHPLPNQNSIIGTEKIIEMFEKCKKDDLIVVLISGGGSALFVKPRVNLEELQKTTDLLLKSGADIKEINTIRKHLSYVKGGQLAKFTKAKILSFIVSDIIGDPLEFIASGPTYPDSTTYNDAKKILKKYDLYRKIPDSVRTTMDVGVNREIAETPKKDNIVFKNVENYIIVNNKVACKAAELKAKEMGYKTIVLTTSLDGEASEIGRYLSHRANNYVSYEDKVLFISGGETTVTIHGDGKGGRNQELVLSCIEEIKEKKIVFTSFATDGIDGNSDAAGAVADGFTFNRSSEKGLKPKNYLINNDSNSFFKKLNDLLLTGPTGTNVMDVQLIIKYK